MRWTTSLLLILAAPALAADGIREINHTCAIQTGCFPGDTPGYPVSISEAGSYRLTSNLTVDLDTNAVYIGTDDVSVDLGGFEIRGPNDCTPGNWTGTCVAAGGGSGLSAFGGLRRGLVVRNGTIRGMGSSGIDTFGSQLSASNLFVIDNGANGIRAGSGSRIMDVSAEENGAWGISVDAGSVVADCTSARNISGIMVGAGSVVRGCTSSQNNGSGIGAATGFSLSNNSIYENGSSGISTFSGATGAVAGNTIVDNGGHGVQVDALVSVTENLIEGNTQCGVSFRFGVAGITGSLGGNTLLGNNEDGSCTGTATQKQFQGFSMATSCNVITCSTGGFLLGTFCPPNIVNCL